VNTRTTLITGGTGKLGRILVADRLARGEAVIVPGTNAENLAALERAHAEEARAGRLLTLVCDLTGPQAVETIGDFCHRRGALPHALVNNARNLCYLRAGPNGVVSQADFIAELTLDVVAPYGLTMALAQAHNSRLSRVVNIGSQYGMVAPNPALYDDFARQSFVHYGVAKAALIQLTRELAVRLAPRVQVNCISFGGVEGRVDDAFRTRYAALAPAGRMLREDEIAGPVEFLLSDASSGMTGHNLVVDGGWTAW
jgi:NAD(P)-dependent dehydrogenase (short-subunit alcohol dehydrogenase family)